jgi:hypothetical protein
VLFPSAIGGLIIYRGKFFIFLNFNVAAAYLRKGRKKENVHSMLKHFNLFLFISFAYSLHFTSVFCSLCVYLPILTTAQWYFILFFTLSTSYFFHFFLSFIKKNQKMNTKIKVFIKKEFRKCCFDVILRD